ncbi:hypothetical protein JK188_14630 [Providencia sp. JGM181]|nr:MULTISPECIES: hypothetical protein [unclassified Providencia]MBS0925719.1 hypothetical protein [Providencia sp. JGM181]MBS0932831.1 hypothetical protein [Providencia sp. JGM172]MBS0997024.1 hypothetical protein [Providencia sp. JGM178]
MIYQTGTITTTAGQTKIKGTGTRWKDNLAGISEGCPISYLINNVVYMNTVLSVNSDTEINLTYPVPVAASAAKYQIATFVLDSMSDGVRKMLANQQYIQYFLRNMDTWMTQDGIVEIKTPTGDTVRLESIIALKNLIDGKFDKKGGEVTGPTTFKHTNIRVSGTNDWTSLRLIRQDGSYVMFQTNPATDGSMATIVNRDKDEKTLGIVSIPNKTGTAMLVGDFGVGSRPFGASPFNVNDDTKKITGFFSYTNFNKDNLSSGFRGFSSYYNDNIGFMLGGAVISGKYIISAKFIMNNIETDATLLHSLNTTKDSNGNIKAASPIIKVFADHIELNDESEGVTLKKLHTGIYQLHGVLGLHPDANWGGINGGITIPCGINQLPLVYALYDVLEKGKPHPFDGRIVEPDEDGDIVLYTTYRKHDLPQNIQYERFKLYPEFLKEVDGEMVELTPGEPCDIPNGHWIDVRVNMPSDSIYNQKLAEAERLAKIEAERVAKEDADETAREEAERSGDESKQEQASKLEE